MKNHKFIYLIILLLVASNLFLIQNYLRIKNEFELALVKQTDRLIYKPVVVRENYNVKLGERYAAEIYLACVNENNLPKVLINDSVGKDEWKFARATDTLHYDEYFNSFYFEKKPSQKGLYFWNGVIVHNYENKPDSLFFYLEYVVE